MKQVKCINACGWKGVLENGKVYTVREEFNGGNMYWLEEIEVSGFFKDRFVDVEVKI